MIIRSLTCSLLVNSSRCLCVILVDLGRWNYCIGLHVFAAHGLDNYLFLFRLLELPQRVILRFERLNKRVPVAAKIFLDNFRYLLLDEIIRDFEFLLLRRTE